MHESETCLYCKWRKKTTSRHGHMTAGRVRRSLLAVEDLCANRHGEQAAAARGGGWLNLQSPPPPNRRGPPLPSSAGPSEDMHDPVCV